MVVTGGATAGHVVPAIPVMLALRERGCHVEFIGGRDGPERSLVTALAIPYHAVQSGKLRRYFSLRNATDCFRIVAGVWQAWRLLARIRPQVVFSKGGFVSFPCVVGAWLHGIPVVAHESDLSPGLANRLVKPFIATLCVNFAATAVGRGERVLVTGTPLRQELLAGDADRGRTLLGVDRDGFKNKRVLLIVGGSLGATTLNEVVREALDQLLRGNVVVHICGPGKSAPELANKPGYVQREYVDEGWGDIIAAADLVVSRAGANALYEWLSLGKPHLLVPLPASASRGDQIENAAYAADNGWSLVVAEHELNSTTLVAGIAKLSDLAPEVRRRLRTFARRDSTELIVRELERAAAAKRRNDQETPQ